jgi:hypothetical protein
MTSEERFNVYRSAYKQASCQGANCVGKRVDQTPKVKTITDRALAILKKGGKAAARVTGKGISAAGNALQKVGGKEGVCPECGKAGSNCTCK